VTKTIEENFADWEGDLYGFGYRTGEEYTLAALKTFFATVGDDPKYPRGYDYRKLEAALTPTVAWLLINIFCGYSANILDYGTSPRHGWLTEEGEAIKAFMASKSVDELVEICCSHSDDCYPDSCNCGPRGYQAGIKCPNPFWKGHHP
jgi:hypothetical protein